MAVEVGGSRGAMFINTGGRGGRNRRYVALCAKDIPNTLCTTHLSLSVRMQDYLGDEYVPADLVSVCLLRQTSLLDQTDSITHSILSQNKEYCDFQPLKGTEAI